MMFLDTSENQDAELVYASISSNRNENNICCRGRYLLHSKCRRPIVYDLIGKNSIELDEPDKSHKDDINGQSFIRNSAENPCDESYYFITTSHDKTAKIWQYITDQPCKVLLTFDSPDNEPFISRSSIRHNGKFISVTATIEGNIYLWHDNQLKQNLHTDYCCFYSKINSIEYSRQKFVFVFLAGSDNKIHAFQVDLEHLNLHHLFDLQGHSDWIKCLDILPLDKTENSDFLIASASQDTYVRVWLMNIDPNPIDRRIRTIVSGNLLNSIEEVRLTATLETVLSGHEGIVHSLSWFKDLQNGKLRLVTCSADKTIVVWESSIAKTLTTSDSRPIDQESDRKVKYEKSPASEGKWVEIARLGETGETNLPFLGVCLASDEKTLFAQSLRGAIHSWKVTQDNTFLPYYSITGHFEPVSDISWEESGKYLLSVSQDKTCRLHAIAAEDGRWHEVARPQVHGHEINCVASIDPLRFATGSEEKVIRVFRATKFFMKNHESLAKDKLALDSVDLIEDELPAHAQLPALGLSIRGANSPYDIDSLGDENSTNKPKKKLDNNSEWHEVSKLVKELSKVDHLESLPVEEILLQSTLWWERNKLFGHGNELHTLTVDCKKEFLASASRANREDLASVIVWECEKFRKVSTISHHNLTVTRLRFSPDSKYLLSVSRDRTWCLSERNPSGQLRNAYIKLLGTSKIDAVHERIIWDSSWTHDSKYFLTVSRDKKAVLWSIQDLRCISNRIRDQKVSGETVGQEKLSCFSLRTFDSSIQAVDSRPSTNPETYLFALGFESGTIELFNVSPSSATNLQAEKCVWAAIRRFDKLHQLPVRRLAFRPCSTEEESNSAFLASGADDCVVKLMKLRMPQK